MNGADLKAVIQGIGMVEISTAKAGDYFSEEFMTKFRISGNDEIYVPVFWLGNQENRKNIYNKKPVLYSEAALGAEKIIRHIDENMVSRKDYPIKPSYSHRGGRPVFKWGTGRHTPYVPRSSWIRAFGKFYKFDYVALCIIRHNPRKDMYSAMVFFRDNAVIKG